MLVSEPWRWLLVAFDSRCPARPRVLATLAILACCPATPVIPTYSVTLAVQMYAATPAISNLVTDPMAALNRHSSRELMRRVGTVQQLTNSGLVAARSKGDSGHHDEITAWNQ